jgi:hypothetical protein
MARKKEAPVKEVTVSFTRKYPLMEKVCVVCGKPFMGTTRAKYDTNACRQAFNYNKHAEKYRAHKLKKYHAEKKAAAGKK